MREDLSIPDPKEHRCSLCNTDGFNRTGLVPINYVGLSTTSAWATRCPNLCEKGLVDNKNNANNR